MHEHCPRACAGRPDGLTDQYGNGLFAVFAFAVYLPCVVGVFIDFHGTRAADLSAVAIHRNAERTLRDLIVAGLAQIGVAAVRRSECDCGVIRQRGNGLTGRIIVPWHGGETGYADQQSHHHDDDRQADCNPVPYRPRTGAHI